MGAMQNPQQKARTIYKEEAKVLMEGGNIAKCTFLLMLYNSERQLRQQQNLFARIILYGNHHVIQQMKRLPKNKQLSAIHYLERINFEMIDLLYQNLIQTDFMAKKQTYKRLSPQHLQQKQHVQLSEQVKIGEELLRTKKIAVIIFIGGSSHRFRDSDGNSISKQFYTETAEQKSLMEIKLDKLSRVTQQFGDQHVYIIHNEENSQALNQLLLKFPNLKVRKLEQNQIPIITLSGKLCLKDKDDYSIIEAPSGCGDFINLSISKKKILEDIISKQIEYVYCSGVQNIFQNFLDPYFIGKLHSDSKIEVLFKCTHPESQNQKLMRVIYNKTNKEIQVNDYDNLIINCTEQSKENICRSPVWMNNVIFKAQSLQSYLERAKTNASMIKQVYMPRKIKVTYYNLEDQKYYENQPCYNFERSLSDLLVDKQIQCRGLMVGRQREYMPVLTISSQKIWKQAYRQYQEQQALQQKLQQSRAKTNNDMSLLTLNRDTEDQM